MKVFRGRLVHSFGAHEDIQVMEDQLIGIEDRCGSGKGQSMLILKLASPNHTLRANTSLQGKSLLLCH